MSTDWFWEGNVVDSLEKHFAGLGWVVIGKTDTASRQSGVDLHLAKENVELLIEAKGYPSTKYQRGVKQGLPKPTNPARQARHWYAEALFCAMLRQHDNPTSIVAIAFPESLVYERLVHRTQCSLNRLNFRVLFLSKDGSVKIIGDPL